MEVKDLIKQKRLECGLTMKELGDKIGVSGSTISRWESGDIATMKHSKIALLAATLNISPTEIVPGTSSFRMEEELIERFRSLSLKAQNELVGCLQRSDLDVSALFEKREISDIEREYVDMYRALPFDKQETIKLMIKAFYDAAQIAVQEKEEA